MLKAMALLKRKPSDGAPKAPFKQRFLAWWDGVELPPLEAPPPRAQVEPEPEPPPPPPPIKLEPWENPRIRVRQAIWGEGFRSPERSMERAAFLLLALEPRA